MEARGLKYESKGAKVRVLAEPHPPGGSRGEHVFPVPASSAAFLPSLAHGALAHPHS